MTRNQPMRRLVRLYALLMLGSALTLIYQNCAGQSSRAQSAASLSSEELNTEALAAMKGMDLVETCESPSAWVCETRSFGPALENGNQSSIECLSGSRCVSVQTFTFNTEDNIRNCSGCSAQDILSRYDHTEIRCMNRDVPAAGTLPIQSDGDSLEDALNLAQSKCRELAARVQ